LKTNLAGSSSNPAHPDQLSKKQETPCKNQARLITGPLKVCKSIRQAQR